MKGKIFWSPVLFLLLLASPACDKEEEIPLSGTVTIDSKLTFSDDKQTYVIYGFLFSDARRVPFPGSVKPDITVYNDESSVSLMTGNYLDSFYLEGEYNDAASAVSAFNGLKTVNPAMITWTGMASPLAEGQVWVYRTDREQYAKIRIIELETGTHEDKVYASCTFEWAFQPDGSTNFPAR
ncbi:MAG: hypothetical protein RBU28_01745 [Bacteroidales bacterium]|jgi:hypothetical protein|nr:hypothetical protein [Bacteroidales bacterium]